MSSVPVPAHDLCVAPATRASPVRLLQKGMLPGNVPTLPYAVNHLDPVPDPGGEMCTSDSNATGNLSSALRIPSLDLPLVAVPGKDYDSVLPNSPIRTSPIRYHHCAPAGGAAYNAGRSLTGNAPAGGPRLGSGADIAPP